MRWRWRLCEARHMTPDKIVRWTEIPPVPTAAFKELELSSLRPPERTSVFHSSGTTGQRASRHLHGADSLAIYESSLAPWFKAHLLPDAERFTLILLTPSPARVPHSSLAHMLETVRREFGSPNSLFTGDIDAGGAWTFDRTAALGALRRSCDAGVPIAVLGTAFSFVQLLDHLGTSQPAFELAPGSRVMETGGYKGRSRALPKGELHEMITRQLGIPASHIVCEYGMSELSSQAYDHVTGNPASALLEPTPNPFGGGEPPSGPAGPVPLPGGVRGGFFGTIHVQNNLKTFHGSMRQRIFHLPPWARFRLVSPETGEEVSAREIGLIQVYDLANVRSVMAVQTEDLGVRCGEGFELIGRAAMAEPRGCSLMHFDGDRP